MYGELQQKYSIKQLGFLRQYLNWNIQKQADGSIHVSQTATIDIILSKTGMQKCNPRHSPLPYKGPFDDAAKEKPLPPHEASEFRQTIGDLRYIADSTRRDIHTAVSKLASIIHKPTTIHQQNLKWLLRYLKGTRTHGIAYKPVRKQPESALRTYSDSDYANDSDRKSCTGIIHTLYDAPISWTSSRQATVATSTCKA